MNDRDKDQFYMPDSIPRDTTPALSPASAIKQDSNSSSYWGRTASYSRADYRMLKNLPLEPVYYGPIIEADIANGQPWPPKRLQPRQERMQMQAKAARGDMRPWVTDGDAVGTALPWFRNYLKVKRSVLLSSEPGPTLELPIRMGLIKAFGDGIRDLSQHGAAFVLQREGIPQSVSITRCFPFEDGEVWIVARPFVSAEDENDGNVDRVELMRVSHGSIEGNIWSLDGEQQLGDIVGALETVAGDFGVGYSPDEDAVGWGKPILNDLISIMTLAALTTTDLRWNCANFARPFMQLGISDADLAQAIADAPASQSAAGVPSLTDALITPEDVQKQAEDIANRPIAVWRGGLAEAQLVSWDNNITASIDVMEICEKEFTRFTGLPATELADTAAMSSAAAYVRRFFQIILESREEQHSLRDAASAAMGFEVEWELPDADMETEDGQTTQTEPQEEE